ncbi:MAG: hypothetical protein ACFFAH_06465 [Promethearchaeota archaeon]
MKLIRKSFGDALSIQTLQGFSFIKPHGYAGDYEIIDKIYQKYVNPNFKFKKWDFWYNAHKAAKVIRNRKVYFKNLIRTLCISEKNNELEVLNMGSGPARDI